MYYDLIVVVKNQYNKTEFVTYYKTDHLRK